MKQHISLKKESTQARNTARNMEGKTQPHKRRNTKLKEHEAEEGTA